MNILAVETHYKAPYEGNVHRTSAVDWWRIVNPFTELKKHVDWNITIRKGALSRDDYKIKDWAAEFEWESIGRNYDLVWFSYMDNPFAYSYLSVLSQKYGLKFVIDFDDNMLRPSLNNPFFIRMAENKRDYRNIKIIIKDAPYLTVTNRYLRREYKHFRKTGKNIFVFDNYTNLDVYKAPPHIEDDVITIGWQGGLNHLDDLEKTSFMEAITYILNKHKNVHFSVVGLMPGSELEKLPRFTRMEGDSDFYKWIEIWKKWIRTVDIGVCPLQDTDFNRGKSSIKAYSFWAAKLPVIVSDVAPYKIVTEKTGYRVRTAGQWIDALEALISSRERRRKLGAAGYTYLKKHCLIQNNWWRLRDIIKKIV